MHHGVLQIYIKDSTSAQQHPFITIKVSHRQHVSTYQAVIIRSITLLCTFMFLCDGPDDDRLIGRNMLSRWYFYGNKRKLLCWRTIFNIYTIYWIKVSFNTVLFNTMHCTYLIKIYIGLHVKYPLFFTYFNKTLIFSKGFEKYSSQVLRKSVHWEPSCSMRTNGQTDWQTERQTCRS